MPVPEAMTAAQHQDFDLKVVAGQWPDDIAGDMVFSTPQNSHNLPYAIFDWGAIARLSLTPGQHGAGQDRFAWRVQSIQTPGKRLFDARPDVFSPGLLGYTSPFGAPNSSNTAPLPWGDRLYTTWDAGRPVELHPETMEFVAEVGHIDSWGGPSMFEGQLMPFLFSTAHPVVDPERDCLWTVKLEPVMEPTFGMQPSVVHYSGEGKEVSYWPLDGIAFPGAIHTVSQTRDWVILADSGNFVADAGEMAGGERTETIPTEVPVWLLRKEELLGTPTGTPVTPIPFTAAPPTGHFYARWEDSDGISVVWEGMDLMDLGLYIRPDDKDVLGNPVSPSAVGLYNTAMAPETIVEFQFEPETGKVLERGIYKEDWTFNLQLSGMDWSVEGMSNPTLHHVTYQGCKTGSISQRAAELYKDRIDLAQVAEDTPGYLATFERGSMELKSRWEYPDLDDLITSPTFAPRDLGSDPDASRYAGGEPGGHDGYVVQPVISDDGFRVDLFDAANVGAGPVATLKGENNQTIPLVLHSSWMPSFTGLADAERLRFSDEITPETLASIPEDLHPLVHQVAEECEDL